MRLTGGPLKQAQDITAKYLLELEPDRMMAGYRKRAGLEPKAEGYERLGRRRQPAAHRAYRRALSFGGELDVCRHGRRAVQAAGRLPRQ